MNYKTHERLPQEFLAIKEWLTNYREPQAQATEPNNEGDNNDRS